jgi:hypothetical protein
VTHLARIPVASGEVAGQDASRDRRRERLGQPEGATMTKTPDSELTPAERVDDIPRTLRALREAVQEALWRHKLAGNPVATWKDGHVKWVQPEDIPASAGAQGRE